MRNQKFIDSLGVMDLISEKHKKLRSDLLLRVEARVPDKISTMDIYLLTLARFFAMSISESARHMEISRQAAHKHVKRLLEMGYIDLIDSEHSRREKLIKLTIAGEDLCDQIDQIKHAIELELQSEIGIETYEQIKTLFRKDW
jgi:DNA-binding MarR family transcriptional regulator